MTVDRPDFEDMELQPAEIAAMRWQAIEAANTLPGLSPMARRVLIAMICAMDNRTRACFPSELWLAKYLGVNIRSVRDAKAELKGARLIFWTNPEGPRHKSHYIFNWEALEQVRAKARSLASDAIEERRTIKGQQTRIEHFQQGETTLNGMDNFDSNRVNSSTQKGQMQLPTGSNVPSNRVNRPAEHPINSPTRTAQSNHADLPTPVDQSEPPSSQPSALGLTAHCSGRKGSSGKASAPRCPYPQVLTAFEGDQPTLDAIAAMNAESQARVCKALAMKGHAAALAVIYPDQGASHVQ